MREPFIRQAHLIAGAERWRAARSTYCGALEARFEDLLQARADGFTFEQIAVAYGLTRRAVELALQRRTRQANNHKET